MGIKLQCVRGTDPRAKDVIDWLSKIYNDSNSLPFPFEFRMNTPESVVVLWYEGAGGILLDFTSTVDQPTLYFGMCHLVAVSEVCRGDGVGRQLVEIAEQFCESNGYDLRGAYVETGDQIEFWRHLGYQYQTSANLSIVMSKTEKL